MRAKSTEGALQPRSVTHSLDRAWLCWNSSSGTECSWFRFSRLQKEKRGVGDGLRNPGRPRGFSESTGFGVREPRVQILTRSQCNLREIAFFGPSFLIYNMGEFCSSTRGEGTSRISVKASLPGPRHGVSGPAITGRAPSLPLFPPTPITICTSTCRTFVI